MLIYEVNLVVNGEVFDRYFPWLSLHIEEILKFPGFVKAEVYQEQIDNPAKKNLVVHYYIDSDTSLNNYLANHAAAMRADAANKFPNQFQATRRILNCVPGLRAAR